MIRLMILTVAAIGLLAPVGCSSPEGESPAERQDYADDMAARSLEDLYAEQPEVRDLIAESPGYAVFSNVSTQLLILTSGNGYGVVVDKGSGERTYMKMFEAGAGLGVGLRSLRMVIVFREQDAMDAFVNDGFEFGADANAEAKADDDTGGAAAGAAVFNDDMAVYILSDAGLALRVALKGTKFWQDDEL